MSFTIPPFKNQVPREQCQSVPTRVEEQVCSNIPRQQCQQVWLAFFFEITWPSLGYTIWISCQVWNVTKCVLLILIARLQGKFHDNSVPLSPVNSVRRYPGSNVRPFQDSSVRRYHGSPATPFHANKNSRSAIPSRGNNATQFQGIWIARKNTIRLGY